MCTKMAFEGKTNERPVPGVQAKLMVGPGHISGKQKAAPASLSDEVTNITGRRQEHLCVDAQERLCWSATIYTDPWEEGPG